MKQCPACKSNYEDNTQMFCLNDGTNLISLLDNEATIAFLPVNDRVQISIPQVSEPTVFAQPQAESKSGKGWLIGILVGLFLLSIIAIAGIAGIYFLRHQAGQEIPIAVNKTQPLATNTNIATPTVSPTQDELANIKQKLANLQKQQQEQAKVKPNVPTLPSSPTIPKPTSVTAKANSPNDGFLALRSAPSSETGERILQIPHGSQLTVLGCQASIKGKKGRWCRVDYNGNLGWANDGWMTY
jgi:Bacterial SH3 domain